MVNFIFTTAAILVTVLASSIAQSEIIDGEAQLRTGVEVNCLVRYNGLVSRKRYDPNSPDPETRVFVAYLETGEAGQHGASVALQTTTAHGFLRIVPFEFTEEDFGLRFELSVGGNAAIAVDEKMAFGDITLTVTDLVTGNLVGSSDFPIEQLFAGGYSITQVTVGLPARLLESQKIGLTWNKNLLTQVRFQCN